MRLELTGQVHEEKKLTLKWRAKFNLYSCEGFLTGPYMEETFQEGQKLFQEMVKSAVLSSDME